MGVDGVPKSQRREKSVVRERINVVNMEVEKGKFSVISQLCEFRVGCDVRLIKISVVQVDKPVGVKIRHLRDYRHQVDVGARLDDQRNFFVEGRDGHLVENVADRQSALLHFGVDRIAHFECVQRFFFEVQLLVVVIGVMEFLFSFYSFLTIVCRFPKLLLCLAKRL